LQRRGSVRAGAADGDGLRRCRDGGSSCSPAERRFTRGREGEAAPARSESRALGSGFLRSYSCRSVSTPCLPELWVILRWPSAGTAALRASSGRAGASTPWRQISAACLTPVITYTSHGVLHHSPSESSCPAIWQVREDNFWETDFKLYG